ncbi:patatin-like phospholipase family protein [Burkholderia ubonensis]|uniref:patatin-like phospholipase family protein n=1 Tax=Burkholderia ubonensis TaxID=101571 RepID=UPI0008FE42DF|nr:patatin-like phospholipase family protein [Burkholderia ubonensis]
MCPLLQQNNRSWRRNKQYTGCEIVSEYWKHEARGAINGSGWQPCICIQGGGAKGAWEAGVLAGLIESGAVEPTAMFGTSAGAINALWASTAPTDKLAEHMLSHWLAFARRIAVAGYFVGTVLLLSALVLVASQWPLLPSRIIGLFLCLLSLLLILGATVRLRLIDRVPGIIPIRCAARMLPSVQTPANWHCYFCTADVALNEQPHAWDWGRLATFWIAKGKRHARLMRDKHPPLDPRVAAMTSAALPILFRSLRVGARQLLDGGLEANLPAGYIVSNGSAGGNSIICIVPIPLSQLDPEHYIHYRVLRFLHDICAEQQEGRSNPAAAIVGASVRYPVLVIAPKEKLQSGLVSGFFRPKLLRAEFEAGRLSGVDMKIAMTCFQRGSETALDGNLLETLSLPPIGERPPSCRLLAPWMNTRWIIKAPSLASFPDQDDAHGAA